MAINIALVSHPVLRQANLALHKPMIEEISATLNQEMLPPV